jgi:zinc transporter ZupT
MLVTFISALVLAGVHVFSGSLHFLDRIPRSRWLSFAGGVAVALVFLEILPELAESQETVARALDPFSALQNHAYIIALAGLALFYGMDRMVKTSRQRRRDEGAEDHTSDGVFWLSMGVVATKNLTVGYLLAREPRTAVGLLLFTFALALEFMVGDRGMHADHQANYDRVGRWLLAGVLVVGWMAGVTGAVPDLGVTVLSALLAGMIVLNVLKEELPQERQSRFWAFVLGLVVYGGVLLIQ